MYDFKIDDSESKASFELETGGMISLTKRDPYGFWSIDGLENLGRFTTAEEARKAAEVHSGKNPTIGPESNETTIQEDSKIKKATKVS